MRFIGVDLAWSDRNSSGIAVLAGDARGASLVRPPWTERGVAAVAAAVGAACPDGPAFVAVDAPLWVPNLTGRRAAEAELGRDFARFFAGAHPSNRTLHPDVAGERLAALLAARDGFTADPDPAADARAARRLVFEAYPHPAQVVLFELPRRIAYKRGGPAERRAGLRALRGHVRVRLTGGAPPLLPSAPLDAFLGEDLEPLRGRAHKDYEDRLDALVCAYVAFYYWYWGGARCTMYGSLAGGHIITPAPPHRHP